MPSSLLAGRSRAIVTVLLLVVLTLYAAPVVAAAPAALPLIDHYDSVQGPLDATLGTPAASSVGDANVLGGERDILVTVTSGLPGPAGMHVSVGGSLLSSSQDSGIFGQALIAYDGIDGDPTTLNPTGLGSVDLTQGNTNNGFALTSRLNDLPIGMIITVYTDGTSASTATITLPGGQPSSSPPVTHYIEFAAFTQAAGASAPANFSNVGAVTLMVDGFNDASDLTIEDFRITQFDWGDLPDGYMTAYASDGPRHVISNLHMGAKIDPYELNGLPTAGANGDDTSGVDDEDGVNPTTPNWVFGPTGGSVDVSVSGGSGCLSGWMDWNQDGDFLDASENILSNVAVDAGAASYVLSVPVDPAGKTFYARFRLYARDEGGVCTSTKTPNGQAVNGEVEDYQWPFGPNAVTLSAFSGSAGSALPVAGGVIVWLAVGLLAVRRFLR